jgi:hypothetical protein
VGIQNPDIVEESATSKKEEALTREFGVRVAGNVGAPATPGITVPTVVFVFPLLFRKCGSARNQTRDFWTYSQEL